QRAQSEGATEPRSTTSSDEPPEVVEGYHDVEAAFMTSPSRKIDPAITMRGDSDRSAASASARIGRTITLIRGSMAAAWRARAAGSAERGLDARVTTIAETDGKSASNILGTSLSLIAANTRGSF